MQNTKTYACLVCLGEGKIWEWESHSDGDFQVEVPCPSCVAKGWPPTITPSRGPEPEVEAIPEKRLAE